MKGTLSGDYRTLPVFPIAIGKHTDVRGLA